MLRVDLKKILYHIKNQLRCFWLWKQMLWDKSVLADLIHKRFYAHSISKLNHKFNIKTIQDVSKLWKISRLQLSGNEWMIVLENFDFVGLVDCRLKVIWRKKTVRLVFITFKILCIRLKIRLLEPVRFLVSLTTGWLHYWAKIVVPALAKNGWLR